MIFMKRNLHLLIMLPVSFALAFLLLRTVPYPAVMIGFFLPTLIHVYVFTLLFMVYGALQLKPVLVQAFKLVRKVIY